MEGRGGGLCARAMIFGGGGWGEGLLFLVVCNKNDFLCNFGVFFCKVKSVA